jgi:hypothetical protein
MSKQNLDMIRNITKDLHTKYHSSIMTFVQQKWMPARVIMEACRIPIAAAWSSFKFRFRFGFRIQKIGSLNLAIFVSKKVENLCEIVSCMFFVDGQYHCYGLDYDNLDLVGIWHLLRCSQISNSSTPIFFLLRIFFLATLILNQRIEFPHHR